MEAVKSAVMSNTFDPNKDIPDLSGKVSLFILWHTHTINMFCRSS